MKLNEIFDTNQDTTFADTMQAFIDKHKLQRFDGNNAIVIADEKRSYVYRVWAYDPGFEEWLQYAEKHQDNPHVIKLLSKVKTSKATFDKLPKNLKLNYIKVEKLKPLTRDLADFFEAHHFAGMYYGKPAKTFEEHMERLRKFVDKGEYVDYGFEWDDAWYKLMDEQKSVIELILELMNKGFNDTNAENMMMRGSVVVLTDPQGS